MRHLRRNRTLPRSSNSSMQWKSVRTMKDFQNPVDLMFEDLKKKKPNHFAVRQYAKFKLAADFRFMYGA